MLEAGEGVVSLWMVMAQLETVPGMARAMEQEAEMLAHREWSSWSAIKTVIKPLMNKQVFLLQSQAQKN